MNEFHRTCFADVRMFGVRLLLVTCALMIALASFVVGLNPAMAQMEYDFNGDGEVHCDDFQEQFPETYTDEATEALRQFPDELSDLNNDPDQDDIACEGQPGSAEPADRDRADRDSAERNRAPQTAAEPPETEIPETTESEPETAATESVDVPAEVMARVEGCSVVAISSRDVVGAGCPGVGTVAFRIPDDAPSMQGTVLMNPGSSPAADATAAQESTAATRSTGSNQNEADNDDSAQVDDEKNAAKADKDGKKQSADSDKANKDKNKDGKNKDKKKGKSKGKKNGKKQRKR